MKRYLKQSLAVVGLVTLALNAACSKSDNTSSSGSENSQTSNAPTTAIGPLTKYDSPITVRSVMNDVGKDYLTAGETLEDNVWTKGYERELGIQLKYDWIVERANAANKLNVTLAGGDLPDIFAVGHTQYKQLLEAGKIADLTQVYDAYASEQVKQFYSLGADGLKPVKQGDKLYGLTDYSGSYDTAPVVYIRTDWMNKLKLKPPTTMDELMQIAKAFTDDDPDGNGKQDTYGIALNKDLDSGWTIKMNGFMSAYHAYPQTWIKDQAGTLVYGSIQPEMKTALAQLQELYKAGVIDQEFGTKDVSKASESIMAGKAGIFIGPLSSPFAISAMMQNPEVDWTAYPVPSADGQPAMVPNQVINNTVYVVRKGYEHPEALVKMLNFMVDKLYGKSADQEASTYLGPTGQGFQVTPFKLMEPNKNVGIYKSVIEAMETQDTSKLSREAKSNYDFIQQYRQGDRNQWVYERIFGPDSSIKVIQHYIDNNLLLLNQFSAPPTATMTTKKATLDKLELETFTKIIYGESSIDDFDTFVANWKKLGGDQITEEVNEASK